MADSVKYYDANTDMTYIDDDGDGLNDLNGAEIPATAAKMIMVDGAWVPTGETKGDVLEGAAAVAAAGGDPKVGTTPKAGELTDADDLLADAEAEVAAEEGVNGGGGSGYMPGMYNPTAPVKIETAPRVQGKGPSAETLAKMGLSVTGEAPRGDLDTLGYLGSPGTNVTELTEAAAKAYYGFDANPAQANGIYRDAVGIAAVKGITVQEALREIAKVGNGQGGGKDGAGGSGPRAFTNVTKTIQTTDPGEAERVLNSALATYMGRRASDDEIKKFLEQLNRNEKLNPTITTAKGVTSTGGTTQTQEQEGGFDSTNFAERWARSRKGAAEYQAATTYMDAFTRVIDELEY
jgi:hypothetical protein